MNLRHLPWLTCAAVFLAGCSTAPITEDRMPTLTSDQGIAAISFDSNLTVSQVVIESVSGSGGKLYIPKAAYGQSVYLFVTPAGQYCMHQFHSGSEVFTAKSDDQCFEVTPGKVSYSGTFGPYNGYYDAPGGQSPGGMDQRQDRRAFFDALVIGYPNIAMHVLSTIADSSNSAGICSLITQEEAGSLLGLPIKTSAEKSFADIHTCAFINSDDHAVFLTSLTGDKLEARFDSVIDAAPINGWRNWQPVSFVGTQARGGNKDDEYEIIVLLQDRLLILSVYGGTRGDEIDAMSDLAKTVVSKLPTN